MEMCLGRLCNKSVMIEVSCCVVFIGDCVKDIKYI